MESTAGGHGNRPGRRILAITAVLAGLAVAAPARAQTPTPPLSSTTTTAEFAATARGPETFTQPTFNQPGVVLSHDAGEGTELTEPRIEMSSLPGVIHESFTVCARRPWYSHRFGDGAGLR